ncbi:MAG: DUF4386 domain-containing protein [Actinobacteria bacterium]|nr:DUF4386 domain-containing protein [Actinomycetota bacterium]
MTSRAPFTRVAVWAALASVAASLGAGFLGNVADGVPTPYDSPAAEVAEFFARHSTSILGSGFLETVVGLPLVVFAVGLFSRLMAEAYAEAKAPAILGLAGAGIYAAVLTMVGAMLFAAANLSGRGEASEQSVVALTVLWNTTVVMLGPAAALFMAGFGLAGLKTAAFPNWLGWLAIWGAVAGLLSPLPDLVAPASVALANVISLLATLQQAFLIIWLLGVANWLRRPAVGDADEDD